MFSISRAVSVTTFLFLAAIIVPAQKPELYVQTGHSSSVSGVAFSPDGKTLASAGDTIKLWDVASGQELKTFRGHFFSSVTFSPDGETLASGSDDKTIILFDVATGRELRTFRGHSRDVTSVAFSS